jgi:hypothetical protein
MDNKMQKKFVADTFEKIKEETKKAAEEVSPTKFAEDVAEQTGLKPQESGIEQPPAQKTPADDAKKKAVTAQRLKQLEEEIKVIRQQREREAEEVRKKTPEEKVESGRKVGQLIEEKKEEELPPPVLAAKRKTGTAERRIKGPSG